jgi:aspartokinase
VITITDLVEREVAKNPLYGEAMAEGIVNYSALSRKLKNDIENARMEPVTEGAINMALKRHAEELSAMRPNVEFVHKVRNITVRSDLAEMAFRNSPNLSRIHQKLLKKAEEFDQPFSYYSEGHAETTFVIADVLFPHLKILAQEEVCIGEFTNLSSISVRLPDETVQIPGVYYPFIKAFAWERINFIEIISHFTELNFVVEEKDVERAFAAIKRLSRKE